MAVLNSKLHIQNAYYYGTFQPVPEPEGIYSTGTCKFLKKLKTLFISNAYRKQCLVIANTVELMLLMRDNAAKLREQDMTLLNPQQVSSASSFPPSVFQQTLHFYLYNKLIIYSCFNIIKINK
jgi:hypothetical protein